MLVERHPAHLQTDKGTEFLNKKFQSMLKSNAIRFYTTENSDIKASVVERFNRTLKTKMWKYFTYKNTYRYIDILQDLLHSYNNTHHRSIAMTPIQVSKENEDFVRNRLYGQKKRRPKWKYQVGDRVRISKTRIAFTKGYLPSWSEEIFSIVTRIPTDPITYELADLNGVTIKGKFYEVELQRILKEDDIYRVDKILKSRKRHGKTEYFVKWKGYDDTFNSWTGDIFDT
jgi:Chromo (CHRromatin Organisation MOdifier) domain